MDNSLEQVEIALEEWAANYAQEQREAARLRREAKGSGGEDTLNRKLIDAAVPAVAGALRQWIKEHTGTRGQPPIGLLPIQTVGPERAAVIGLMACFNAVTRTNNIVRTVEAIGRGIESELWLSELVERDEKLALRLFKQVAKKHKSRDMQLKAIRSIANRELYGLPNAWGAQIHVNVGGPILDAILKHARIFEIWNGYRKSSDPRKLVFTEEARGCIGELAEFSSYSRMPMLVPPRPWPRPPYLTKRASRSLRPVRAVSEGHREVLKGDHTSGKLARAYGVLNRLQGVPFRVNLRVLKVLRELWDRGESVGKMPRKHPLPDVPAPANYEELPAEEQKRWRLQASKIKFKNAVEIPAQSFVFERGLFTADYLSGYEQFYLPINMCFRGRVYPIPYFNYQLSDPFRGLFEFADGKPLGKDGFKWLSIHVTNCGDFDKLSKKSYEERLNWVAANFGWLWKCASDPVENREWTKADNPFQFLAALFEWKEASSLERPQEYVSYLPIGLDGSNSGLQHYSAIMRSREEAAMVNLLPSLKPADVYQNVADRVKELLEQDPSELASLWLSFGIDRKTVKRSVMTSLYGSGRFGYGNHLKDDLMRPLSDQVIDGELEEHPLAVEEDNGNKAASYLAGLIDQALKETLTRTNEAMAWVRQTSGALSKAGHDIRWVTPVGWPIVNHYEEPVTKRIELFLYNRQLSLEKIGTAAKDQVYQDGSIRDRIRVMIRTEDPGKLCKHKQRNTIAPNLIHSMDASHLMLTIEAAAEEGIRHVLTIHDCFATHAGDVERFSRIIRETFVQMYENYDPLDELYRYAKAVLGEDVLPPPERGDLQLTEVLESPYFFA